MNLTEVGDLNQAVVESQKRRKSAFTGGQVCTEEECPAGSYPITSFSWSGRGGRQAYDKPCRIDLPRELRDNNMDRVHFARTYFAKPDGDKETDCAVVQVNPTTTKTLHETITTMTRAHSNIDLEAEIVELPDLQFMQNPSVDPVVSLAVFFVPMLSMLFFPTMLQNVQLEKDERQMVAMQIQSLKLSNYWIASYAWNLLLYFSVIALYYGSNYMLGIPKFVYALH